MEEETYVGAIDEGTSSTRFMVSCYIIHFALN